MANLCQEELSEELFPQERELVAVEVDFQAWDLDLVRDWTLSQEVRLDGASSVKRASGTNPVDDLVLCMDVFSEL